MMALTAAILIGYAPTTTADEADHRESGEALLILVPLEPEANDEEIASFDVGTETGESEWQDYLASTGMEEADLKELESAGYTGTEGEYLNELPGIEEGFEYGLEKKEIFPDEGDGQGLSFPDEIVLNEGKEDDKKDLLKLFSVEEIAYIFAEPFSINRVIIPGERAKWEIVLPFLVHFEYGKKWEDVAGDVFYEQLVNMKLITNGIEVLNDDYFMVPMKGVIDQYSKEPLHVSLKGEVSSGPVIFDGNKINYQIQFGSDVTVRSMDEVIFSSRGDYSAWVAGVVFDVDSLRAEPGLFQEIKPRIVRLDIEN